MARRAVWRRRLRRRRNRRPRKQRPRRPVGRSQGRSSHPPAISSAKRSVGEDEEVAIATAADCPPTKPRAPWRWRRKFRKSSIFLDSSQARTGAATRWKSGASSWLSAARCSVSPRDQRRPFNHFGDPAVGGDAREQGPQLARDVILTRSDLLTGQARH